MAQVLELIINMIKGTLKKSQNVRGACMATWM